MKARYYGAAPWTIRRFTGINIPEFMHYLYLPVVFDFKQWALPGNIYVLKPMIEEALLWTRIESGWIPRYVYVTAVRGIATPGNPLNRPGWHCDSFGTTDMNFIWWKGAGTRFLVTDAVRAMYQSGISADHLESMKQFDRMGDSAFSHIVTTPEAGILYGLDPFVIHATPIIESVQPRQFVKISFSDHEFNLEGNSHNYLLDYDWKMFSREEMRNDPHQALRDFYKETG